MKYILEVGITTVILIVLARLLYGAQYIGFVGKYYATIFAVVFIYAPLMIMWRRRRHADFLDTSFGMFFRGVAYFAVSAVLVFPVYLVCAHFWMMLVHGRQGFQLAAFPDLWKTVAFQVLLIALPEEFFYRGYMQGTLNLVFRARRRILGADIGWALPVTALIFAFSHSFVHYQWWHFSIFFPALLFGWLREKTGSITAPILFHALSNILTDWMLRSYY